jgi:nucleotide-binding universal stress UspA family protein
MKISNILVATDFSPSAVRAVATAADYARHFQAQLIVLHAYRVDIPVASPLTGGGYVLPDGFFEHLAKEARLRVEKVASEVAASGVSAIGIAIDRHPATAIIEEAKARKVDLIVMGTRGLTGIKHLALGSVADRVVRTAPCPVLTVAHDD